MLIPCEAYKPFLEQVKIIFDTVLNQDQRDLPFNKVDYWRAKNQSKKFVMDHDVDLGTTEKKHFYNQIRFISKYPDGVIDERDKIIIRVLEQSECKVSPLVKINTSGSSHVQNEQKAKALYQDFLLKQENGNALIEKYPQLKVFDKVDESDNVTCQRNNDTLNTNPQAQIQATAPISGTENSSNEEFNISNSNSVSEGEIKEFVLNYYAKLASRDYFKAFEMWTKESAVRKANSFKYFKLFYKLCDTEAITIDSVDIISLRQLPKYSDKMEENIFEIKMIVTETIITYPIPFSTMINFEVNNLKNFEKSLKRLSEDLTSIRVDFANFRISNLFDARSLAFELGKNSDKEQYLISGYPGKRKYYSVQVVLVSTQTTIAGERIAIYGISDHSNLGGHEN